MERVRIDQWLHAVRICKDRKAAREICEKCHVKINGISVKPSRKVSEGEEVVVKIEGIERVYKVEKAITKRVGAKIADTCKIDLTPKEELEKHEFIRKFAMPVRPKGSGRPSKKDRRQLEKFN
ncbi:MAG: RNA-binding S4 domain-containing protein [Candidatus Omnitrophica bacterium]|nr:RNA-binding S4 domain-containing protein [Candidatus Omnitrophota bacterium]